MGFPRQQYWSGLPFPPSRDLPDPGIEPASPVSPELAGRVFTTQPPGKPPGNLKLIKMPAELVSGWWPVRNLPQSRR